MNLTMKASTNIRLFPITSIDIIDEINIVVDIVEALTAEIS